MTSAFLRERVFWMGQWNASKGLTATCCVLVLLIAASMYLTIFASAQFVQELTQNAGSHTWLVVAVAAMIVQPVLTNLLVVASVALQRAVTCRQHERVALVANAPHGIGHLEAPEISGRIDSTLAELRGYMGLNSTEYAWRSIATRATAVAALVAVVRWSWIAALALLALQLIAGRYFTTYLAALLRDIFRNQAAEGRRAEYLYKLLVTPAPAKEVRLFGITDHLLAWHRDITAAALAGMHAGRAKRFRPAALAGVVMLVGTGVVIGFLARDAWQGSISAAVLVSALQGIAWMRGFGPLGDISTGAARARAHAEQVHELERDLLTSTDSTPGDVAPRTGAAEITLDGVGFTYPSRSEPVFSGLDLHIPAGQSVAIVGVNGVGKSTLIKLLAGLYPPTAGSLRIDGSDPFVDDATRRRVAVIFQDFVRYHLSLRENVLLGVPGGTDEQARDAMNSAAALDVLERVGGLDVPLDPSYDGGTDLSGGQWQRVALSRAFAAVAAGAGVLVLDEPTAALDVRVEAEIFEHFLEATRGMTTILVSHRLSSVRHAQRIVVLGHDGVVEDGSHEELMAAGGEYAQMFTLQATRFAQSEQDSDHDVTQQDEVSR